MSVRGQVYQRMSPAGLMCTKCSKHVASLHNGIRVGFLSDRCTGFARLDGDFSFSRAQPIAVDVLFLNRVFLVAPAMTVGAGIVFTGISFVFL